MIILDAFAPADAPALMRWREDPEVTEGALTSTEPVTRESTLRFMAAFDNATGTDDRCWAIREQAAGPLLGYTKLVGIERAAGVAEFGIVIGEPSARGRGLGAAALDATLDRARSELGLRRVWLRVVAFNERAIALYASRGFIEEGRLRAHAYRRGALHDVLLMGLELPPAAMRP